MRTVKKPPGNEQKLVYLVFADNRCYCRVTNQRPIGVTVDLVAGTWEWRSRHHGIGRPDPIAKYNLSPIVGVYSRMDIAQLTRMVNDAIEVQKEIRSLG